MKRRSFVAGPRTLVVGGTNQTNFRALILSNLETVLDIHSPQRPCRYAKFMGLSWESMTSCISQELSMYL
jgi:hypothetical protein